MGYNGFYFEYSVRCKMYGAWDSVCQNYQNTENLLKSILKQVKLDRDNTDLEAKQRYIDFNFGDFIYIIQRDPKMTGFYTKSLYNILITSQLTPTTHYLELMAKVNSDYRLGLNLLLSGELVLEGIKYER
jgi:SPX domain protein involved in polyphosphate accumulation